MSKFTDAVAHHLQGVHFFSTGAMKGCPDCGLADDTCPTCEGTCEIDTSESGPSNFVQCTACHGTGKVERTDREIEAASEPHFSWSWCDSCGSHLGGDRHPAHGIIAKTMEEAQQPDRTITHFDICTDCVMYHANGDEPENWGT